MAAPPKLPECRSRLGPVMTSSVAASPRSWVEMAGVSLSHCASIADQHQVARHLLAVLGEEARQRGRAALLLALDQHGDGNRRPAGDGLPRPDRLQEGHELALVVLRAARHDHLAVGLLGGDARLEGGRLPQLERVGRLHVVVAVEQHVRPAVGLGPVLGPVLGLVVADHHGMTGGGNDLGVEADLFELARAPLRGLAAFRRVGGVGRDTRNADEIEEPLQRLLVRLVQRFQDFGEMGVHRSPCRDMGCGEAAAEIARTRARLSMGA